MSLFCFVADFIILYDGEPVATFVFCPTVAALTYEEARSCALEAVQEHVRGLSELGLTAYFHLAYLPQ